MGREIAIKESDIIITTDEQFVAVFDMIARAKRGIKEMEDYFTERGIAYMKDKGKRTVKVSETSYIGYEREYDDVFESDAIKKELGFTERQLAVLPKNPQWKKTAVLSDPGISFCNQLILTISLD